MLEQLFGSKTRVRLLQLLLNNPGQPYYLRELARYLKIQLNAIRREINNLEKLEIVKFVEAPLESSAEEQKPPAESKKTSKKYFLVNADFALYPELRALFLKSHLILEKKFIKKIETMAKIKLFILTGSFVGNDLASTDILLVGTINRQKLARLIHGFQKDLNHEINYTVMTLQEFNYRKDITDRFLYDILEGPKIVIMENL